MGRKSLLYHYTKYKREWCEARGYKLDEVDEEVGINGECYVCIDEWYNNEWLAMKEDKEKKNGRES